MALMWFDGLITCTTKMDSVFYTSNIRILSRMNLNWYNTTYFGLD